MTADSEVGRSYDADGKRWYTYPPTGELLRSVTSVIGGTQDKPWLAPWAAKLAVQWTIDNYHRLEKLIREFGPEAGRAAFEKEAAAAAARLRDLAAAAGTYTHDVIEVLILSKWQEQNAPDDEEDADAEARQQNVIPLPPIPDVLVGEFIDGIPAADFADMCIEGFMNFCDDHDPQFIAAEMKAFNQAAGVAGTVDWVGYLRKLGITAVGDNKTGKDLSGAREQLAAYRRMPECLMPMGQVEPMPAAEVGVVLHLRPSHEQGYERGYRLLEVSAGDDAVAWNSFRRAVRLLNDREQVTGKPGRVLYPPLPDGSQPPPRIADLDGEGYGRLLSPLVKAGLGTVADLAELTEDGCLAIRNMGSKTLEIARRMLADHGLSFAEPKTEQEEVA
jgi:hypothetical protein